MTEGVVGNLFIQCLHEKCELGSRSNQAHLSLQYVDHLWNLIDSQFSDNFSHSGYSRIVFCSPDRAAIGFRAFTHRAKFIDGKRFVVLTDSLLTIEDGTRTIDFNRHCRQQGERGAQEQSNSRYDHIDHPFCEHDYPITTESFATDNPLRRKISDRNLAHQSF